MIWHPFEEIKDCGLLELSQHQDMRGYFMETFNKETFAKNGIPLPWGWAQDNISYSHAGVMRGFHFQKENPQGKLITCLYGNILDVCLDLRKTSPSYLKMTRVLLSHKKAQSFYLPPGTAHAFLALEDSLIHYRCSTPYHKESDYGIDACSPELAMVWPMGEFLRSDRDRALPKLMDYLTTIA